MQQTVLFLNMAEEDPTKRLKLGYLSPSVEADRYFDFIVDAKTLLQK